MPKRKPVPVTLPSPAPRVRPAPDWRPRAPAPAPRVEVEVPSPLRDPRTGARRPGRVRVAARPPAPMLARLDPGRRASADFYARVAEAVAAGVPVAQDLEAEGRGGGPAALGLAPQERAADTAALLRRLEAAVGRGCVMLARGEGRPRARLPVLRLMRLAVLDGRSCRDVLAALGVPYQPRPRETVRAALVLALDRVAEAGGLTARR